MKNGCLTLVMVVLLLTSAATARVKPDVSAEDIQWQFLSRMAGGESLVVELRNGGWIKGGFVNVDPNRLTLDRGATVVDIPRTIILRIWRLNHRKTGDGAAIGAILGAVAGAAILSRNCFDHGLYWLACFSYKAPLGGLVGAGGGAIVGAAIGSHSRHKSLLYDSKKNPSGPPRSQSGEAENSARQLLTESAFPACYQVPRRLDPNPSFRQAASNYIQGHGLTSDSRVLRSPDFSQEAH